MLSFGRPGKLFSDQTQGIYEYLASNRVLFLYGPVFGFPHRSDNFNTTHLADSIMILSKLDKTSPIWLIIDSEGGSVRDGLLLYDAIKSAACPVYTVGRSCYSLAAIILSAGETGHRYVFPHSQTMLHLPIGAIEGDSSMVEVRAGEMKKLKNLLIDLLVENGVHRSKKQILKDIDRECWLDAQETIDYGLADRILSKGEM